MTSTKAQRFWREMSVKQVIRDSAPEHPLSATSENISNVPQLIKMDDSKKHSAERVSPTTALDIEFLPLVLVHTIHRNLKSSQVEIVPQPYYPEEGGNELESEEEGEPEPEAGPPPEVVFAPPLPAFKEKNNWWDFSHPVYSFNNPVIRSRIELLMTSRIVHITDRKYIVKLQEMIKRDYAECLKKRCAIRAADEIEREKRLLLEGKITYEEVPEELRVHPVCIINQLAQRIIKQKKKKMKIADKTYAYRTPRRRIRTMSRIMKNTVFEKEAVQLKGSTQILMTTCGTDADEAEDIARGLMFSKEDYAKLKPEHPLVQLLREIDAVNDMYELAHRILSIETDLLVSSKKCQTFKKATSSALLQNAPEAVENV